jgi:hypothetical protein
VSAYGPARVMHYVEALPYQKNLRNPAGWLRRAIENGYELDLPPARAGAAPNGTPSSSANGESGNGGLANAADPSERRREDYAWLFAEDEAYTAWLFAEDEAYTATENPRRGNEPRRPDGRTEAARATDSHPPKRPTPDPSAEGPWRETLDAAAAEIDSSSLNVWFEGIAPVSLEDGTLTISVPNSFAKEYIESRFQELLEGHPGVAFCGVAVVVGCSFFALFLGCCASVVLLWGWSGSVSICIIRSL